MHQSPTAQQAEQDQRIAENMARVKHKLIVLSGKGGVGKTTVAVNLAYGLAVRGFQVGLLDTDIHGPNIAKMLGKEAERVSESEQGGVDPVFVLPNLRAVSISFILDDQDRPIIWRGPLKMGAIRQFLGDVNWGTLDYLIIDSPPGTGDEPLSVCQLIPELQGAIIVTSPQDVAVLDARKSVSFARELGIPVAGMIENMSGFVCPHCRQEINLFGAGGGEAAARDMGVHFLGRIPLDPAMVAAGDTGQPITRSGQDSAATKAFQAILDQLVSE